MPTPQFPAIEDFYATNEPLEQKVARLYDAYIGISRYLTYLLSALDTLNVSRLDAKVIKTGTLDANLVTVQSDLAGGAYIRLDGSGIVINNGVFDTFKADITGQVTMTGATIRTTNSSYPLIELNSQNNSMTFYYSPTESILITPNDNDIAKIRFQDGASFALIYFDPPNPGLFINTTSGTDLVIQSGGDLRLFNGVGRLTRINSWSSLFNQSTNRTLQQELDALWSAIAALSASP